MLVELNCEFVWGCSMAEMKHKSILNKLTKKELVHLIEKGQPDHALDDFKVMRTRQRASREKDGFEPCWECRFIARKLGLEE